jgi:hypothetical protein
MKVPQSMLLALAVAVTLTSVAAAGPDATKQRVAITSHAAKTTRVSLFVLSPLQAGPVKRDSGTMTAGLPPGRDVMRGGQRVSIYDDIVTLKGKRGSLVLRYRSEYVAAGNGHNVSTNVWKVVRGTGQYARVTGGGRGGSVVLPRRAWSSRDEGFLTLP